MRDDLDYHNRPEHNTKHLQGGSIRSCKGSERAVKLL